MDIRITIQNIDRQLRAANQDRELLRINCQVLGTLVAKQREAMQAAVNQTTDDAGTPIATPATETLTAALALKPYDTADTIIRQGIALAQLRALIAAQQTKLDQLEAAEAERAKAKEE